MSLEEFLEDLIRTIIIWTFYLAIIALILIIVGAAFLPSIGSYIKSGSENEFIKLLGLSDTVNNIGSSFISFGGTLRLFLIVLGVIVLIVLIGLAWYFNRRRKKRDQLYYGNFDPYK